MMDGILTDPDRWGELPLAEQRRLLAEAVRTELDGTAPVEAVEIEIGPVERPYDLTIAVCTEVGTLRAPLWSHARASLFTDRSVHPENRRRFAPGEALREALELLRPRLAVPYALETRGLQVTYRPADGVERTWSAERSLFRGKTAVVREDRIEDPGEADLRELLARHYAGPSLRVVGDDGTAFLLPGSAEIADGALVSLCPRCRKWEEGVVERCPECGSPVDTLLATRPPRP
jgi:hypothetical protein